MIAPNTLEIITESQNLILAPFDKKHLREVLPLPMKVIAHLMALYRDFYLDPDPQDLFESEQAVTEGYTWGIYSVSNEHLAAPQLLLGTVALYQDEGAAREIATVLFHENILHKGIGTLAKLAIAKYAFAEGAASISAQTSIHNIAAQRSLAKVGFSRLGTSIGTVEFANGHCAPVENWLLVHESALETQQGRLQFNQIAEGWKRYQTAAAAITVKEVV